jgi:hypothetical protein
VFLKYRVSLRLDNFSFFMERFEYVVHDITTEGKIPASSKYGLVQGSRTGATPHDTPVLE